MKRKIRILICLIFAILVLTAAAGCGGGGSSSTTSSTVAISALPQPSVDCGGQSCIQ